MKKVCLACGYWIKGKEVKYKCYTKECPAKQRDDKINATKTETTSTS